MIPPLLFLPPPFFIYFPLLFLLSVFPFICLFIFRVINLCSWIPNFLSKLNCWLVCNINCFYHCPQILCSKYFTLFKKLILRFNNIQLNTISSEHFTVYMLMNWFKYPTWLGKIDWNYEHQRKWYIMLHICSTHFTWFIFNFISSFHLVLRCIFFTV